MPQTKAHSLIDTHGHYVFDVDDGAVDPDMSAEMVRLAQAQGITDILCTSHNWGDQTHYRSHLAMLQARLQQEHIPVRLHPGCEIYCDLYTFPTVIRQLKDGTLPPMGNSNHVLLEFHPYVEPGDLLYFVDQVRKQTVYLPIIAHIERYFILHEDPDALNILQRWDVPIQINAYSLVEEHNTNIRRFAQKMLAEKRVAFIGSDAHRTTHRPPLLASGIDYICQTCDDAYARAIFHENAETYLLKK